MNKRTFLKTGALLGAGSVFASSLLKGENSNFEFMAESPPFGIKGFTLPELTYPYDALEPYIDKETMELHHSKHHRSYVRGFNNALKNIDIAVKSSDYSLIKHWQKEVAFHGAGHFLHSILWKSMGPNTGHMSTNLKRYVALSFGSVRKLQEYFIKSTRTIEGSGWGILSYLPGHDRLVVLQAEKHQNLSQWVTVPILVCDVWEHAYYLKYKNDRTKYLEGFFKVINWDAVSARFEDVLRKFKR